MDPISHVALARLASPEPATWLGSLLPDLVWYALYPAWLRSRGGLQSAFSSGDWPLPPRWIRELHYATHSLLVFPVLLLAVGARHRQGRRILVGWLLHVLLDIPTHSRDRMAPRPLWPVCRWAYDGLSWTDALARGLAAAAHRLFS